MNVAAEALAAAAHANDGRDFARLHTPHRTAAKATHTTKQRSSMLRYLFYA